MGKGLDRSLHPPGIKKKKGQAVLHLELPGPKKANLSCYICGETSARALQCQPVSVCR
jgi:hypothetical protein